mmetsp:Transcript_11426/g.31213  ORF Transcript_11426/g.31213 Transcript_11426/m.31213 type:complete len:274 (+) Transcript_11426:4128-4949(+)
MCRVRRVVAAVLGTRLPLAQDAQTEVIVDRHALSPGLHQGVIADCHTRRLFILEGLRRPCFPEPIQLRPPRVQLWCTRMVGVLPDAVQHRVHVVRQLVHRLRGLCPRVATGGRQQGRRTNVLPPERRQARVVGHVRARGAPAGAVRGAVELHQAPELRGHVGQGLRPEIRLPDGREAHQRLPQGDGLGDRELRIEPRSLTPFQGRRLEQRPRAHILVADLHALLPVGPVWAGRHAPLRPAVRVRDGGGLEQVRREGRVPKDLLGDLAPCGPTA